MPRMYQVPAPGEPWGDGKFIPAGLVEGKYLSKKWVFTKPGDSDFPNGRQIPVRYGTGDFGSVHESKLWEVLRDGGEYDKPSARYERADKERFEGKNIEALLHGTGKGVLGNWADSIYKGVSGAIRDDDDPERVNDQYIAMLEKHNPVLSMGGKTLGFAGSAIYGGVAFKAIGQMGKLQKVTRGVAALTPSALAMRGGLAAQGLAARKLGLEGASAFGAGLAGRGSQVGRMGMATFAGGAAEEGIFETSNLINDGMLGDANITAEAIMGRLGFASILGGALGGGLSLGAGGAGHMIGHAYEKAGVPLPDGFLRSWSKWLSKKGGKKGEADNLKDVTEVVLDPELRGMVNSLETTTQSAGREAKVLFEDMAKTGDDLINLSRSEIKKESLEGFTEGNVPEALDSAHRAIYAIRAFVEDGRKDVDLDKGYLDELLALADEAEAALRQYWERDPTLKGINFKLVADESGLLHVVTEVTPHGAPREVPLEGKEALSVLRGIAEKRGLDLEKAGALRGEIERDIGMEEYGISALEREADDIAARVSERQKSRATGRKAKKEKVAELAALNGEMAAAKTRLSTARATLESLEQKYVETDEAYRALVGEAYTGSGDLRRYEERAQAYREGLRGEGEIEAVIASLKSDYKGTEFLKSIYFKLDDIKKSISGMLDEIEKMPGDSAKKTARRRVLTEAMGAIDADGKVIAKEGSPYDILASQLEDRNAWGPMGDVQREWNEAVSELMALRKIIRGAEGMKPGDMAKKVSDYEGVNELIRTLSEGDPGNVQASIEGYIKSLDRLIGLAKKYYPEKALEGISMVGSGDNFFTRINAFKKTLEDLQKVINARSMMGERFETVGSAFDLWKRANRVGYGIGLYTGGAGVGAALGFEATNQLGTAIREPLYALGKFAQLAGAKKRYSDTIDKWVRKTAKGMSSQKGGTPSGSFMRDREVRGAINMMKSIGIREEGTAKKRKETLAEDAKIIIEILDTMDPMQLDSRLNESLNYLDGAPDTQEALRQSMFASYYYLKNNLPTGIIRNVDAFTGDVNISMPDYAANEFMETFAIIADPTVAMKQLANNSLSVRGVKTLRDNFPDTYEKLKVGVFERIAGKDIPFSSKMQLSILFGEALTPMANPAMVNLLQQQYAPDPEEQQRKPSRAKLKAIGERSEQMMTPAQRAFAT